MKVCEVKKVIVKFFWGLILYYLEDLLFALVKFLFDIYIEFRKIVEVKCRVRFLILVLDCLKLLFVFLKDDYIGRMLVLKEFVKDYLGEIVDLRLVFLFFGGEIVVFKRFN